MPPAPKAPGARQRQNRSSTKATLVKPDPGEIKVPPLPRRSEGWTGMTKAWWRDVWSSPMSPEFDDSDIHGLWALAAVVDDFWKATSARERQNAAAEIRLQSVRFGLSPMDRRRLEWQIVTTDDAKAKAARRQNAQPQQPEQQPERPAGPAPTDPRSALRLA
jgi:hypothetical protein